MKVKLAPKLIDKLKKQDVRLRKSFKKAINLFSKDPHHSSLNNHDLYKEWEGHKSIDITNDYRAIYEEITEGESLVAYFVGLGTHKELYEKETNN